MLRNDGARTLIAQALEAELAEPLAKFKGHQDAQGRTLAVSNGYQPEREIQTGIGAGKVAGFSLHAGVTARADERAGPT